MHFISGAFCWLPWPEWVRENHIRTALNAAFWGCWLSTRADSLHSFCSLFLLGFSGRVEPSTSAWQQDVLCFQWRKQKQSTQPWSVFKSLSPPAFFFLSSQHNFTSNVYHLCMSKKNNETSSFLNFFSLASVISISIQLLLMLGQEVKSHDKTATRPYCNSNWGNQANMKIFSLFDHWPFDMQELTWPCWPWEMMNA